MNTECMFLYALLTVYMIVYAFTDFITLKTSNKWHLSVGIVAFSYAILKGEWFISLIAVLFGLVAGLLIRRIPHNDLGYGDVKMLMVSSIILSLFRPDSSIDTLLLFVAYYLVVSFLIMTICRAIQKRMKTAEVKFGSYRITKSYIETPEAIPLLIVCLLLPFFI